MIKPTKKELNQAYYLTREIENLQRLIDTYSDAEIQSPKINGMPAAKTNVPGKPTEQAAIRLVDLHEQLEELQERCIQSKAIIMHYIKEMDDSYMRQIVAMRCLEMMKWEDVAEHIGGNNTAESCRQAFNRAFE